MMLPDRFEQMTVTRMLTEHPQIGAILEKHRIDCVTCGSSSCLLKNVIAQHTYDSRRAAQIEAEINAYLAGIEGELTAVHAEKRQ